MPLRALQPGSHHDARRRNSLDPTTLFRRNGSTDSRSVEDARGSDRGSVSHDLLRPGQVNGLQHASSAGNEPKAPPTQDTPATPKNRRFSMKRFRHASDTQLSAKAKEQAPASPPPPVPPVPAAPAIITTAPTVDDAHHPPKKKKFSAFTKHKASSDIALSEQITSRPRLSAEKRAETDTKKSMFGSFRNSSTDINDPGRLSVNHARGAPANQGGERRNSGTPPILRLSDSSRSDGSSADNISSTPGKKQHSSSSTATLFKLRRRRTKGRASLFPLPVKIPPPNQLPNTAPATPRASSSALPTPSPDRSPSSQTPPITAIYAGPENGSRNGAATLPSHAALAASSVTFAAPAGSLLRNNSTASKQSTRSSPAAPGPMPLRLRGRSSTLNSIHQAQDDVTPPTPPFSNSGRTSTSTAGRSSLSTFFTRSHRRRHNSDSPRHGSPGQRPHSGSVTGSQSNSLSISRETLTIPGREEGETPPRYLERLEETCPRHKIAGALAKSADTFQANVLRSFMRKFPFFGDPLDMAIRKLLMEVELPQEAQHIDRVLEAFANRYQECNPGIFPSPDSTYFVTFSIVVLHTDFFNSNNKRKMQKHEYVKNATKDSGQPDCSEYVLGYFYDNIVYTRFISFFEENNLRFGTSRKKKKDKIKGAIADPVKRVAKEPIDPYEVIMENNLDYLRPSLRNTMFLDDPYSFRGNPKDLNMQHLHASFCRFGVLQIVSSRSRPDAFMTQSTIDNPEEAQAGVVEIPVTKVGIVWRKDAKKKKGRSPWNEWGAILTSAGLSFFRNAQWVKSLIHQHEGHNKSSNVDSPVVFKPPLETFKSDQTVTLGGAVALVDNTYRKHKNAVLLCSRNVPFEIFLADNESDLNDWLMKINYAATFQTVGIRPRGLVGGHYEGQRARGIRRLDSSHSTKSVPTPTGEVTITSGRIDNDLRQQIVAARRELIEKRISETEDGIFEAQTRLEGLLRDARHVQLLAPIQPKTREEVVHAASRLSAQIRWGRVDISRMKCHREMMLLDLEEEKRHINETMARNQQIGASSSSDTPSTLKPNKASGLARLNSKASSVLGKPHRSPHSPTSQRPGTKSSFSASDLGDEIFKTPPQSVRDLRPDSWELPPLDLGPTTVHRGSLASMLSPAGLTLSGEQRDPIPDESEEAAESISSSDPASAFITPPNEEADQEVAKEPPSEPAAERQGDAADDESDREHSNVGSPDSRSRVRRSLQRTLREARETATPGSHHHRGRKANHSVSSAGTTTAAGDDGSSTLIAPDSEVLSRTKDVFTVHGKKASIITFGSDWQNMSAEERLKVRKQALSTDETGSAKGPATATGLPSEYRSASIASASTATAGSARELWEQEKENVRAAVAKASSLHSRPSKHRLSTAPAAPGLPHSLRKSSSLPEDMGRSAFLVKHEEAATDDETEESNDEADEKLSGTGAEHASADR